VATSSSPFGRWLRSRRNILGCLGALVGVVLGAVGVLPSPWWPLGVVALYAAGALAFPGRTGGFGGLGGEDRVDVEALRDAVAEQRRRLARKAPRDVQAAADRLVTTLGELFARPDLLHRGAPETFVVERLVEDYLPTAIDGYLRLPPGFADTQPLSDGRTARQVLVDQLGLLETAARDATQAASRDAADLLLSHGRFLADKFGPHGLDLSAAPPPLPPAGAPGG
jgi:hypothetical protein